MGWVLEGVGYFFIAFGFLMIGSLIYHFVIEPIMRYFDINIGDEKKGH